MITVCPGCRQHIHEHSAVLLSGGLMYHQRCAPGAARPAAAKEEIFPKVIAVLVLAAPFLILAGLLFLLFPILGCAFILTAPFVIGWCLAARKIRDRYRR